MFLKLTWASYQKQVRVRGSFSRHLRHVLDFKKEHYYNVGLPLQGKRDPLRTLEKTPVNCPHESVWRAEQDAALLGDDVSYAYCTHQAIENHPIWQSTPPDQRHLIHPCAIHMDGAEYSKRDSTWNITVRDMKRNVRHLFSATRKEAP